MSPLACSLLVLAASALLAVADATVTPSPGLCGGKCKGFTMDIPPRIEHVSGSFNFMLETDGHNEVLKDIPDYCSATGRGNIAKQIVDVCNEYSGPIKYIFPPAKVQALGDTVLSPAYASCEKDPGCGPLSWNITQMCRIGPYRR
ncbi:uncharacterized protein LOC134664098 isoform X1 [Cydia fagiglandana]|uniref:uncharacterized protein LOC134664098 isoform X1 n=1 Tax=Cydia fagiglandana TaxID=1458189 RepID=UPI002FEE20EA